jgi:hypothetical protein
VDTIARVISFDVAAFCLLKSLVMFPIVFHSFNEIFIIIEVRTGLDGGGVPCNDNI